MTRLADISTEDLLNVLAARIGLPVDVRKKVFA